MSNPIHALEQTNVSAHYDFESKLLRVTYREILSPEVTKQFYQWLMGVAQANPQEVMSARGSIYDFSMVTEFVSSNISTTSRESHTVNQQNDLTNHPVALVVSSMYQERMVNVMMKVTEQQTRKRIVHTVAEAVAFIDKWHENHAKDKES